MDISSKSVFIKFNFCHSHAYVKIGIVAVLLWYLFRYQINGIVDKWMNDSSWSHGFLIPFFSLYFINQNKDQILKLERKPCYLGLLPLIACIVFFPLNVVHFRVAYFESLVIVPAIGSVVLLLGGWRLIRYTWLPVLFLLFAIPLPQRFYTGITIPMRVIASNIATMLLNIVPNLEASASGVIMTRRQLLGMIDLDGSQGSNTIKEVTPGSCWALDP